MATKPTIPQAVAENPETARTAVLYGWTRGSPLKRGLGVGFDRYLAKPVDLQRLLDTIDQVLRARPVRPLRI